MFKMISLYELWHLPGRLQIPAQRGNFGSIHDMAAHQNTVGPNSHRFTQTAVTQNHALLHHAVGAQAAFSFDTHLTVEDAVLPDRAARGHPGCFRAEHAHACTH